MLYHFVIISGEDDEFVREIIINSQATFLELHEAIQESVNFDKSQIASFFLSDAEWNKGQEVTLMSMERKSEEEELIMKDIMLESLITEEKARMIYQFDFFSNRGFFIELMSIGKDRKLPQAALVRSVGDAPEQILLDDVGLDDMSALIGLTEEDEEDEFKSISFEDMNPDDYEEFF